MKYKIDWLAFTINFKHRKSQQTFDKGIFRVLNFDLNEFEEVPGRFLYNSGATFNGYVNVYWNDEEKPVHKKFIKHDDGTVHWSRLYGFS